MKTLILTLLVISGSLRAELIPAERLVDWTPQDRTGISNGVDYYRDGGAGARTMYVNAVSEGVDNTGATDVKAALQALIDACPANQYVYLPAGTYRIDSALSLGTGFSNKTLRGAGPEQTTIDVRAYEGIRAGDFSGSYFPPTPVTVTGGLTKGSTTITISATDFTPDLDIGDTVGIQAENDATIPVVSVAGYNVFTNQGVVSQSFTTTAKTSNTITFWPPLLHDFGGGALEVRVGVPVFEAKRIGIEDLTVDATNYSGGAGGSFSCVSLSNCVESWVYNCKIRQAWNYNLVLGGLRLEVRKTFIDGLKGGGSNGAGILVGAHSSLVEDNIIVDAFPLIEINSGSAGNVFAYNYGSSSGFIDTNHGPHNRFNLYEGNAVGYGMSDGYFGGESEMTVYRNFCTNESFGTFHLRRFTRKTTIIGNIFSGPVGDEGYPNMGNTDFDGTAQPSLGDYWRDYNMTATLTGRTDADNGELTAISGKLHEFDGFTYQYIRLVWGENEDQQKKMKITTGADNVVNITTDGPGTLPDVGTVVKVGPGSFYSQHGWGSYQERDLDVAATTIKKGNKYIDGTASESLGGDTLVASLFRSSKPAYFGELDWPPFDPTNIATADPERIPAGYRFFNETEPGPGGSGQKRGKVGNKEIRIGGKVIKIGDN